MEAICHIAAYGFFLRDMTDTQATYQIESAIRLAQQGSLFRTFKHATLGMQEFAGTGSRSGTTLGSGDTRLLWGSIYGRGHMLLTRGAAHSNLKMNFSPEQLQLIQDDALLTLQNDIQAAYILFEWSAVYPENQHYTTTPISQYNKSINMENNWKRISAITCLQDHHDQGIPNAAEEHSLFESLISLDRNALLLRIDQEYINPNRLTLNQVECLLQDGWPLIAATDGGANKLHARVHQLALSFYTRRIYPLQPTWQPQRQSRSPS
jgi:hypothetical protein